MLKPQAEASADPDMGTGIPSQFVSGLAKVLSLVALPQLRPQGSPRSTHSLTLRKLESSPFPLITSMVAEVGPENSGEVARV